MILFFIISGFCIHLRWARAMAEGRTPEIRFIPFWKHRFFRLYPPYLLALCLYLGIQSYQGLIRWNLFRIYDVISHLLMLHNFDIHTLFSIDGVFWTLAIEEQLYLAYFLLLYLRTKWGWGRTLVVCISARLAWFTLAFVISRSGSGFQIPHEGGCFSHWFVWALGAIAIESALGLITLPSWTSRASYALICFAVAISFDVICEYHLFGYVGWRLSWLLAGPIWGLGLFITVNQLVSAEAHWRTAHTMPRPITLFAGLGLFSYSTYLMHNFVLLYVNPVVFRTLGIPNSLTNKLLFLPMCLALSWLFFLCVEKHFIRKPVHRAA